MIQNADQLLKAVNDGLTAMKIRPTVWWAMFRPDTRAAFEALPVYLANPQNCSAFLSVAQNLEQKESPVITASPQMTKDQLASKLGIDFSKVDWQFWVGLIEAIIAAISQHKAQAKAAGCPEHDCKCHEAAEHALAAACLSLQCCEQPSC